MIVLYSFPWRMSALLPVVVLTLVSIPVAHAAENLVGNGGAEAVDRSGKVTGWAVRNRSGIVAVTADIDDKTEGRQAARIQPQGGEAANFSMQVGHVAVP